MKGRPSEGGVDRQDTRCDGHAACDGHGCARRGSPPRVGGRRDVDQRPGCATADLVPPRGTDQRDHPPTHRPTSKFTKAWFAAHPRWVVHFTPPHASWVNQVELFFSILERKVIKNGNFKSRDDLITKLLTYIADYDQTAKPFKWTYAADPLVA